MRYVSRTNKETKENHDLAQFNLVFYSQYLRP